MQSFIRPRYCWLAAILLHVLLLAGCGRVLSVEPLLNLSESRPDADVEGKWILSLPEEQSDSPDFLLFVSAVGKNQQEALFVEFKPGKILRSTRFYLYPAIMGGRRFASIKAAPSPDRARQDKIFEENYVFITYTVSSDRLKISELVFNVFERGIQSGILKGSIAHRDFAGKQIRLTDSTDNIRVFIEKNLSSIQDEKYVIEFRRVELKPK